MSDLTYDPAHTPALMEYLKAGLTFSFERPRVDRIEKFGDREYVVRYELSVGDEYLYGSVLIPKCNVNGNIFGYQSKFFRVQPVGSCFWPWESDKQKIKHAMEDVLRGLRKDVKRKLSNPERMAAALYKVAAELDQ